VLHPGTEIDLAYGHNDGRLRMAIIYYTETDYRPGTCFLGKIKCRFPEMNLEIVTTVDSLKKRLKMNVAAVTSMILAVDTMQRMDELLEVTGMVSSCRVILILPERRTDIVSKALNLSPTYIGYGDTDLYDVESVLEKIHQLTS
jgi:hypothetical protein